MIYHYFCYKKLLKETLLNRKKAMGKEMTFQKMANACRIQKTYLSNVLNKDIHLNSDQLYYACQFLSFTKEETQFCLLLLEKERTVIPERKLKIENEIQKIKIEKLKIESEGELDRLDENYIQAMYYTNPITQLVHLYLTIKKYQKDPCLIKKDLQLKEKDYQEAIGNLCQLGLIEIKKNELQVVKNNLHLAESSPLFKTYTLLMRQLGLSLLQSSKNDSHNFTALFTADKKTQEKIYQEFLTFIKKSKEYAQKAKAQDVYYLSFDLSAV